MRFNYFREDKKYFIVDHKQGSSSFTGTDIIPICITFDANLADKIVKFLEEDKGTYDRR